jgi:hypothetical protein
MSTQHLRTTLSAQTFSDYDEDEQQQPQIHQDSAKWIACMFSSVLKGALSNNTGLGRGFLNQWSDIVDATREKNVPSPRADARCGDKCAVPQRGVVDRDAR